MLRILVPPYTCVLHAENYAVCGRYPNRRRSPHTKLLDRFRDRFNIVAFDFDKLRRQPRLIDQNQMTAMVAHPAECFSACRHPCMKA